MNIIPIDFYNTTIYNKYMSVNKNKVITYFCEFCGKENTKFVRKDLKYRFCNQSCNAKSRISLLNDRDRSGSKNPAWIGGRKYNGAGYVLIYKPDHPYHNDAKNIYVFEHRLVMEQKIGRFLGPHEVVHHINHKRDDNRPENLELFDSHSEHVKSEHKPWNT